MGESWFSSNGNAAVNGHSKTKPQLQKQNSRNQNGASSLDPFQWSITKTAKRAAELLKIKAMDVKVPEAIYANAQGSSAKAQIRDNYLQRRAIYLEELSQGRLPYLSTDADGTCTFKTVQKVENTRSIGSLQDKYFLRMLLKAFKKMGAYFEVNTARTGFIPGPSLVGTEGPKFKDRDGEWRNPRSPNEISGLLHEFGIHSLQNRESKDLFDTLVVNGLSAGARHDPRGHGRLQVSPATIKYGKFIAALNEIQLDDAPKGFLSTLEDVIENKDEHKPLKVLEYKSIPWIFIEHPEFRTENYFRYINLVEKSRSESISDREFFERLRNADLDLPRSYYDPSNPPRTEDELTSKMRSSMLACLVPHAFDSDNIVRKDKKLEFYKTIAKFARSPQAQEWAEQNYGIPKGTDLFTINGYDVSHVDFENFEDKYPNLTTLVNDLSNRKPRPPVKEHVLMNIVENLQPYSELAPNTSKADVFDIEALRQSNSFVIGAGDSAGSDAILLAQALILGGAGFIVRGLMTPENVASKMVELLAEDKNQWHDYALTKVGSDSEGSPLYRMNKTGKVYSASQWSKVLLEKYQYKILRCNNVHENNAFNAAIFSEFFEGDPEFDLEIEKNARWVKEVEDNYCEKSLTTPKSDAVNEVLKEQVYETPTLDKYPVLKKIPILRGMLDPKKAGKTTSILLGVVSKILIGAAPVEIIAEKLGMEPLALLSRQAQRLAYATNTIASGISRGLVLSSHKFYWQFIGEVFGLVSTFFPATSTFGRTLRAINQTVLIGRANELSMRTNYNLDDFKNKKEMKEVYNTSEKAQLYYDKKEVAAQLTRKTMKEIDYLTENFMGGLLGKVPGGKAFAATIAQFKQAGRLAMDFVTTPQLRKHTLANFFTWGAKGPTKMSKNSGKAYGEVHEENTYAFAGMATLGTAIASSILGKLTGRQGIDTFLTNVANMIPALGIVTAGKLVHQDQAGDPRLFTDVTGRQHNYSPEKSGMYQMISGWLMAIFGAFQHTTTGAVLYNLANGVYFEGIREQLKVGIDDAAVNNLTRQGKYYKRLEQTYASKRLAQAA